MSPVVVADVEPDGAANLESVIDVAGLHSTAPTPQTNKYSH